MRAVGLDRGNKNHDARQGSSRADEPNKGPAEGWRAGLCKLIVGKHRDLLETALLELRVFTYLLHPPNLADDELQATLRAFIDGFAGRTGLQARARRGRRRSGLRSAWGMTVRTELPSGPVRQDVARPGDREQAG